MNNPFARTSPLPLHFSSDLRAAFKTLHLHGERKLEKCQLSGLFASLICRGNICSDLKQRRTKIGGSPRADFFLLFCIYVYMYPSLPSVYIHRALLSNRASPPRVHDIQNSQSLFALLLRVHRAAKYLSRRLYVFFFISYYISLLFRESESNSFFCNKNRKKKCHVNALHYISY